MALTRGAPKKSGGSKFQYRGRTAEEMQRRASQSGGTRDSYVSPDVKFFTPQGGPNRVRILPPTWDNAPHFGYEIYLHYGVGSDNGAYLCHDKMKKEVGICPVCRERARAETAGEKDYADSLKPGKRVSVMVINRDKPQEGPLLWNMPWTVDRDICAQAVDKDSGEVYQVDNPDDGYDVHFNKEGTGQTTKYVGLQIARRSSPVSDKEDQAQEWLDYAVSHPVPSVLVFYPPEHIEKIFNGAAAAAAAHAEQPSKPTEAEEEAPAPASSRRTLAKAAPKVEEPEISWDDIHNMSEEELVDLIDAKAIADDLPENANEISLTELSDAVCEVLKIEKPAPKKEEPAVKPSYRDRLRKLQQT